MSTEFHSLYDDQEWGQYLSKRSGSAGVIKEQKGIRQGDTYGQLRSDVECGKQEGAV